MPSPAELAQQRLKAIADLEQQVANAADAAQKELYGRLLERLQDIHADPSLLPALLAEYHNTVLVPLVYTYGQAMLHLPELNVAYFQALDVAGYQHLRAPLTDFIAARLGIDSQGNAVRGGFLDLLGSNTAASQQVIRYAYGAQAGSAGITAYREGLKQLVLGGDKAAEGLVRTLYRESMDDFSRNDRQLQTVAATRLGLRAYLYQGGLIQGSRPFCKVRNGKVFLDSEIELFGTSKDKYPGYTNKKEGLFSGKSEPYQPFTDLGGYSCRHTLNAIPNVVALRMRPGLAENDKGELYVNPQAS